jgi:predicted deacylase
MKFDLNAILSERGKKTHGFLEVSRSTAGLPIGIHVDTVTGVESGPTLVVTAAVHGSEVIGTMITSRFFKSLEPQHLKGTFIGVPVMNMSAFEAENRMSALDQFNLGALFPGEPDGSISSRIAYAFWTQIARRADCLIDLHGQDHFWQPTSSVVLGKPQPEGNVPPAIYRKTLEIAKTFGVRHVWRTDHPRNIAEALINEKAIPAIRAEFGGVVDFRAIGKYVELGVQGLANVMKWMGMMEGNIVAPDYKTCILDQDVVFSSLGGLWATNAEVGNKIEAQELVGTISDPFTADVLEEIRAPFSGTITMLWASPLIKPAALALGVGKEIEYI